MFAIALAYTVDPTSNSAAKCVVAFLVIYQFFYNWGISPYTFLIGGEIPAQRIHPFVRGGNGRITCVYSWYRWVNQLPWILARQLYSAFLY
jgi:hypothetical protein